MESKSPKKIAVIVCKEVSDKCSAGGCFRAFNKREDAFEMYNDKVEMTAFTHCSGCSYEAEEWLDYKIEKLIQAEVDTLHLSTCIRGRCPKYLYFAEKYSRHFDVIGYTHGSKEGKKNNSVKILKK